MENFSGLDRRHRSNRPLSIVVDVGVTCLASLGEKTARLIFLAHNVPSTIAVRVLFHEHARRATELEVAAIGGAEINKQLRQDGPRDDPSRLQRRLLGQRLGQGEGRVSAGRRVHLFRRRADRG